LKGQAERQGDQSDHKRNYGVSWSDAPNVVIAFFTVVLAAIGMVQAGISRESARQQLRAYISVEAREVAIPRMTDSNRYEFHLVMKNSGLTPAYAVTQASWAGLRPHPLPDGTVFPLPTDTKPASGGVVNPRQEREFVATAEAQLSATDIDAKDAGIMALYLYTRVDYKDAFGRPRYTTFGQRIARGGGHPFGVDLAEYCDSN